MKLGQRPGLDFLARLFERRLGRALSEVEHQTLAERFRAPDGVRLGDLVFGLTPEQLGVWLTDLEALR